MGLGYWWIGVGSPGLRPGGSRGRLEVMVFVSLTRLRIRSIRFMPMFAWDAVRSNRQVQRAAGFQTGRLLADRRWTFWTMTAWDSQSSMRQYMTTGSHKTAMPKLMRWCDEASVAHWEQESAELPEWADADARMRTTGRPSKVLWPTAEHASLSYAAPRVSAGGVIRPVG